MDKFKHPIKDRNIKIYYEDVNKIDGNTISTKVYIHPKGEYIHAYIRQLSADERVSAKAAQDNSSIEFTINARSIKKDMFVEFRDKTYQIGAPDHLDFSNTEIKFLAKEVNKKVYEQVIYEDWK